jgi:hypothetical protein
MMLGVLRLGLWSEGPVQAADVIIYANRGGVRHSRSRRLREGDRQQVIVITAAGAFMEDQRQQPGDCNCGFFPGGLDDFVKRGKAVEGTVVEFARAGNGVAVKEGARKWDISTSEGFKRAMLEANRSCIAARAPAPSAPGCSRRWASTTRSGQDQISENRLVTDYVAKGEVEVGIQQTNVIQPYPGAVYLRPLPAI